MDYAAARSNMVESQVRTNKVTDRSVIQALLDTPRERFVPVALRGVSYLDEDLPIGGGRHLIEPMVLARMLQAARITGTDRVLEIACATGYGSLVMGRLAGHVVGLDCNEAALGTARRLAGELRVGNVEFVEGALADGAASKGPFDVILVNGAVIEPSPAWMRQLVPGGRLLVVLKRGFGLGQARLYENIVGGMTGRTLFDAATPLLPELLPEESFVF